MKWVRRILIWLLILIVASLVLLVVFISPVAKWTIEKYSVQYTGRQVKMDKLRINLFTGSINVGGLKIYEAKSNTIFFQCNDLYANIEVHKLLASEYDLTEIKADHPILNIIETGKRFNFSDLIDRFAKKPSQQQTNGNAKTKWSIEQVTVIGATISYVNTSPYNSVTVQHCNIDIPGISWNNKVYSINTDFALASGGEIKAKLSFNKNTWIYGLLLDINQFNIKPVYTYLKDYLKVNSLDGLLSTHLAFTGNMHNAAAIAVSGNVTMDDFLMVDNLGDKLTAADKMSVNVDSVNTEKNLYRFSTISLVHPYLKLEMYKDGYNFNRLSTSPAATTDTSSSTYANIFVMMADYIQNIVKNYVVSDYNADKVTIQNGEFEFLDYTLYDKFRYNFTDLNLTTDRISNNKSRISIDATSTLNNSGKMTGNMSINPNDFKDFDLGCSVKDIAVADFNPYTKYYVATPFLNGTADYTNKTSVVNQQLKSDNILIVNKIIAGKKDKTNKPQYNMPVRLAVALLKDVHGNIKLDIPVAGSLNDPKFKWGRVVWQVLGNLITKAATAPFRLLANAFGGKEADYKEVDFNYLQTSVDDNQQKQLTQLVKALKEKTDIKLELIQVSNKDDEAEALAIYQAKKKYLQTADSTDEQRQRINAVSIDDSAFVKFVDASLQTTASNFESTQEKCIRLIGKENLQATVANIMQQRNDAVTNYLLQQQISKDRLLIHNTDKANDPNLGNAPKFVINMAANDDSGTANKQ